MGQQIHKLTDFAFIDKGLDIYKEQLVKLAEDEDWGLTLENKWSYPVLWNYLEHTFSKLYDEKKIVFTKDNEYCSFNTGLLTSFDNCIYAIFQKNKPNAKSHWKSKGFCRDSDSFFPSYCDGKFPERADYFVDPSKLIYNPQKNIMVNYDHIIRDNRERFPVNLKSKADEEIKIYLSGVIEKMKTRLVCNYKIAVPNYYNGNIQLLIPLYLTSGSSNPDLALSIHENKHNYTASTCLTISMAYNNARLIVKPQSDWLKL